MAFATPLSVPTTRLRATTSVTTRVRDARHPDRAPTSSSKVRITPTSLTPSASAHSRNRRPSRKPKSSQSTQQERRSNPRPKDPSSKSGTRAKIYRTKQYIHLIQQTSVDSESSVPSNSTKYILCSACSTAYVGNAISDKITKVSCPTCGNKFETSKNMLYVNEDDISTSSNVSSLSHFNHTNEIAQALQKTAPHDAIRCKHFSQCSGCTISDSVSEPPVVKLAKDFFVRGLGMKQELSVEHLSLTGWRTHAKLAIRKHGGIGLFKAGSHDIVSIPSCIVHHPSINQAAIVLERALLKSVISPYDEITGKGGARYVLLSVHRESGQVQVTIVWNASSWKEAHPHSTRVGQAIYENAPPGLIHSVWFNWNVTRSNVVINLRKDAFHLAHGERRLVERIGGAMVYFPPAAFRQANLDAFEHLIIPRLLSYIPERGARIVELYAGVGVISLAALKDQRLQIAAVTCVEVNPHGEDAFHWSLRASRIPFAPPSSIDMEVDDAHGDDALEQHTHPKLATTDAQAHDGAQPAKNVPEVEYLVGTDNETISTAVNGNANVLIIDPPRAGVSEYTLERLATLPADSPLERLIYVSCGFDSFSKDALRLTGHRGAWDLRAGHAYVLFPGSDHVEILAVFDRRRSTPES